MRILPSCNEGFRRLSVVAAVVAVLFTSYILLHLRSIDYQSKFDGCYAAYYKPKVEYCYNQADKKISDDCLDKATAAEKKCLESAPYEGEAFLIIMIIADCFAVYLSLLVIRTLGWIAAGFKLKSN